MVQLAAQIIVGRSPQTQELRERITRYAASDASVLILGETGTGKELVARWLHLLSPRANGPFVAVNCGGFAGDIIDSELFGHERGAFTGAIGSRRGLVRQANRGTLFLDEIGDMPRGPQARLLRFLDSGEVRPVGADVVQGASVRVIAATNRSTETLSKDLLYRLRTLEISIAPLRSRQDDVDDLLTFYSCGALGFRPPAREALRNYPWPGNVRELRSFVECALIGRNAGDYVRWEDLPSYIRAPGSISAPPESNGALRPAVRALERQLIIRALDANRGNITAAARCLGMGRTTLGAMLRRMGIVWRDKRAGMCYTRTDGKANEAYARA